jgi:hypothetical protein
MMHFAINFLSYSTLQNARTTLQLSFPELVGGGVAGGDGGCVSRGEGRAARGSDVVRTGPQPLVVLHRLATGTSQQCLLLTLLSTRGVQANFFKNQKENPQILGLIPLSQSANIVASMQIENPTIFMLNIFFKYIFGGFFIFLSYYTQHCFICRSSDSTVPTDAGIEPRTLLQLVHWQSDALTIRLDLIRLCLLLRSQLRKFLQNTALFCLKRVLKIVFNNIFMFGLKHMLYL